jgi:hypothetical protein
MSSRTRNSRVSRPKNPSTSATMSLPFRLPAQYPCECRLQYSNMSSMYRQNNDSSRHSLSRKREQLIHRRTKILWNSMYLCVRERVRVCLLSETSSSCKICAFFCVVSMALSILCKTNKLAFEQVRGLNKHSRRDLEDFLPSQLPSPAKRKRKCVEEPAHLGCRT